jgi:hypothetical protein
MLGFVVDYLSKHRQVFLHMQVKYKGKAAVIALNGRYTDRRASRMPKFVNDQHGRQDDQDDDDDY